MNLKEMLGAELYNSVQEKIGDQKIGIVSDGNWIPKEKFDTKNDEVKELRDQLKSRDEQLNDLKSKVGDSEELKSQIQELQNVNGTKDQESQKKIDDLVKSYEIEKALKNAKAKNPTIAKKALEDLESITVKDGKLIGFEEQLNSVIESDPYLFQEDEPEEPEGLRGHNPKVTDPNRVTPPTNPFSAEHFNLTEQGRMVKENPELAEKLKAQAK